MSDLFEQTYNPDVLSCLANLSNDEVFTPPDLADQVLDMLPEGIWHDPDVTFLDPCCKSGVFLREIAKRLIDGLQDEIPELQERLDHIFKKQIFGIATTELCSLLSRRSLYCSKYPNCKYSVVQFDVADGNVRYRRCEHKWRDGRCEYCGASQEQLDRVDGSETYAYELIHSRKPEELFNMKFDVIIGNPPYQLNDGGNNASARPIYQLFVHQAKRLEPRYLTMIIPARWYAGGKGLDSFRGEMLEDSHITHLVDYPDSKDCFPGVDIAGGVCYFLYERDTEASLCEVKTVRNNSSVIAKRKLNEYSVFIRDSEAMSIIQKVGALKEPTMDNQVSSRKPFGLATNVKPLSHGDIRLRYIDGTGPYERSLVSTGADLIDKWKVVASYVAFDHAGRADREGRRKVLSVMRILPPGTICTETYLVYGSYSTEQEAENLKRYLSLRLPRYLISQLMVGQHLTKSRFALCPIPDVEEEWTDDALYQKYGLTPNEIHSIEESIREIPYAGGEEDE